MAVIAGGHQSKIKTSIMKALSLEQQQWPNVTISFSDIDLTLLEFGPAGCEVRDWKISKRKDAARKRNIKEIQKDSALLEAIEKNNKKWSKSLRASVGM